jgi:LysR family glycine cleavage system transcriptional activator
VLDAAVSGAGVALAHKLIASDDIHAGRLVAPFGPELPLASAYHFVCPTDHAARPNVRAFRDWLTAEMDETKGRWARSADDYRNTSNARSRAFP